MSKHIIDHPGTRDDRQDLARIARIGGLHEGPAPQTAALQRKSRRRVESERLKHFTEIERRQGD